MCLLLAKTKDSSGAAGKLIQQINVDNTRQAANQYLICMY